MNMRKAAGWRRLIYSGGVGSLIRISFRGGPSLRRAPYNARTS